MLYVGVCRLCGFLMVADGVLGFKIAINDHMVTSHSEPFCFVADIPLREFENIFYWTIRNKKEIMLTKELMKNPSFWHKIRNVIIPLLAEANRNRNALALAMAQ